MKLRDFSFLAIGTNPNDDKQMDYYSQHDITTTTKEVDIFRGDFYMVYPVIK